MNRDELFLAVSDYLSGTLGEDAADALEERLFDAASRGESEELEFFEELSRNLRFLGRFAPITRATTAATLDVLRERGVRFEVIDVHPNRHNSIPAWDPSLEIIVTRVHFDVRDHETVEVVLESLKGHPIKTFRGVGCDPDDGTIYALCEEPLARVALRREPLRARIFSIIGLEKRELATIEAFPE